MFESHFGISQSPFQLSPDPSFYFDSRGHHAALAQLRRGLADAVRVVVVTGDIGAGKTTTVRTLLAELEGQQLQVGQIVSTQLDRQELLHAVLLAFGLGRPDESAEALRSRLHRHLVKLDRQGQRALLVIDEAQNLPHEALAQVAALAHWNLPRRMPLQIALVGQPELATLLAGDPNPALRALIGMSCHLGPLERAETASYIEHRLRKVGWSGTPGFAAGAAQAIHDASDGVPRRINRLCDRLLYACYLNEQTTIDRATVDRIAEELREELGDQPPPLRPAPAPAPAAPLPDAEAARAPEADTVAAPPAPAAAPAGAAAARQLLCVVTGAADHVRAAVLMRALAARPGLPPARLLRVYRNDALALSRPLFNDAELGDRLIELDLPPPDDGAAPAELLHARIHALLASETPAAVLVFDDSAAALAAALAAHARGVPLVHVGSGLRLQVHDADAAADRARREIESIATLLYTPDLDASKALREELEGDAAWERVHCAGNLLADAARLGRRLRKAAAAAGPPGAAEARPLAEGRYALVALGHAANLARGKTLREVIELLVEVSRDLALLWPMQSHVQTRLRRSGLERLLDGARILMLPARPYPEFVTMLAGATCVLTDTWSVQEEAAILKVPCITVGAHPGRALTARLGGNVMVGLSRAAAERAVWNCLFNGARPSRTPELWDGKAGRRMAAQLAVALSG